MNVKVFLFGLAALSATALIAFGINQELSTGSSLDVTAQFFVFKAQYGKVYSSAAEQAYRQKIFAETLKKIEAHNADSTQTYTLGINKFSDLTFAERKAKYLVDFPEVSEAAKCQNSASHIDSVNADAKEVDWVKAKKVQAVKDQAQCGSCWAFATAGALESAYAIYKKIKVPSISEQELVDCSGDYGNMGCNGGLMSFAYDYILDHHINSEKNYPYVGEDQECNADISGKGEFGIKGCVQVESNVNGLVKAVRSQPVAIAFYVQDDFFSYSSGVYNPKNCNSQPNHGVLAVGFKLDAKVPYLYVKNSWGPGWGDKGFFKIALGSGKGTCDLAGSGWNYYPTL
jgi:KDEL-tailed cysteine endopeptidase